MASITTHFESNSSFGGTQQCTLLAPANPNRELLIIRAEKDPLFLFADDFVEINGQPNLSQPLTFLEEVKQNTSCYSRKNEAANVLTYWLSMAGDLAKVGVGGYLGQLLPESK